MYHPEIDPRNSQELIREWYDSDPRGRLIMVLLGNLSKHMSTEEASKFIHELEKDGNDL
jgi:hypothetical protein